MNLNMLLVAAAMVAIVAIPLLILVWVMGRPSREMARRSAEARAHRPTIIPLLQSHPQGLSPFDVVRMTGLSEEEVRSCLGGLVMEGLAHQVNEPDEHGRMVQKYRWGQFVRPAAPAPPKPKPEPKPEAPYVPPPQGLSDRWLTARMDIITSTDLNDVHDILHPFHLCKQCKSESASVVMLQGSLLGDMATVQPALEQLGKNPESFGITRKTRCGCGGKATLRRIVLCRTNPSMQNDMHVTIDTYRRATPRFSFLFLDGRYVHLGEDGYEQVFGAAA